MKDIARQIVVVLTFLMVVVVNLLANALPLNGLTTAEISDRFQVYFVPAGYVFSIWGIIYLGLLALTIYQAWPSQRSNPSLRAIGWWLALVNLANISWLFLWHYEQFVFTLAAMLVLLIALIAIYVRLGVGQTKVSPPEKWLVHVPMSLYLGWVTVAAVANATAVLDYLGWGQWGLSDGTWMMLILAMVVGLTAMVNYFRKDLIYTAVILWALAGIGARTPQAGVVTFSIWLAFAFVALTWPAAHFLRRER